MKHLLYTLLLGVFLTSCYRKIDLNEYRTTPKMVIHMHINGYAYDSAPALATVPVR